MRTAGANDSPSPHRQRSDLAMDGSGTQIEPAAAVSDACGAELTGALDESVEQLAGRRVHVRGRPRRAEELACDASSSILACQQRRVLERNAPAGRGCGPEIG